MTNVVVPPNGGGFQSDDRVTRGTIARWSANSGWVDRDGQPIPETVLIVGYRKVLRRWKDKKPEHISEHPLPDPEELNAAIPTAEWETGLDDKLRKPWALTYVVYFVDLETGTLFTYAHDTYGAMAAYTALEEQIAIMRMLRGEHVFPIVRLEKRPWKSPTYGMQMRPHFQIIDWRATGGSLTPPPSTTPQLSGPTTVEPAAAKPAAAKPAAAKPAAAKPAAATPPASPTSAVLDNTKPVKPVTIAELIADELPPWA